MPWLREHRRAPSGFHNGEEVSELRSGKGNGSSGQGLVFNWEMNKLESCRHNYRERGSENHGMEVFSIVQSYQLISGERMNPRVSLYLLGPIQDQHWGLLQTRSHWHRDPAWHRLHQPE